MKKLEFYTLTNLRWNFIHLSYLLPAKATTTQVSWMGIILTCIGDIHRRIFSFYKNPKDMAKFMDRALQLATDALVAQEVPVGCVFVINGNVIAESRNNVNVTRNPTRHAEMNCIDFLLEYCKVNNINYLECFKDVTVYVTVEPCIMCAAALNNLNVKEVVYGCANDRFGGKTVLDVSSLFERSYVLTGNLLANEAMALLKQFYKGINPNAPESKVKTKKPITYG